MSEAKKKRKTVGAEAVERLINADTTQTIVDTQREIDKEYMDGIEACVDAHKDITTPFYIVVHLKKEQLLQNVIRRKFIARRTLPTPQWDQQVWRYYPSSGNLQFCWVLPDEDTAKWMAAHPHDVPQEMEGLASYVYDLLDNQLYDLFYKKFYGEGDECKILGLY